MVLEVDKAAEFRKLKKQHDGEEDPVIVAQRFLNIYRQLHIFSPEKREEFNQKLLAQPSYVRGLFSSLPGGGVLQEYIDDLAAGAGLEIDTPQQAVNTANGRILEAAMSENGPAAPAQPATATAIPLSGTAKVEIGPGFAQELAKALAQALNAANQNANLEVKNMVQTLGQTQLEIVKVLRGENSERKQESERLAVMLTEAQGKIAEMLTQPRSSGENSEADGETSRLVRALADSQAQIAEAISRNQTEKDTDTAKLFELSQQQFIKAVDAINESGKQNSREIARAISDSQQQLANLIIQQNNQRIAASAEIEGDDIKINAADYLAQLNQIADKMSSPAGSAPINIEKTVEELMKAQLEFYREAAATQARELSTVISSALKESHELSTQNLIKALEKLPQPTVIEKTVTVQAPVAPAAALPPEKTAPAPAAASEIHLWNLEKLRPAEEAAPDQPLSPPVFETEVSAPPAEDLPSPNPEIFSPDAPAEESFDLPQFEENTETAEDLTETPPVDELPGESLQSGPEIIAAAAPKKKKKKKKNKNRAKEEVFEPDTSAGETETAAEPNAPAPLPGDDWTAEDSGNRFSDDFLNDLPEAAPVLSEDEDFAAAEFTLPAEDPFAEEPLKRSYEEDEPTFEWQDKEEAPAAESEAEADEDYRPLTPDLVADLTGRKEPADPAADWGFGTSAAEDDLPAAKVNIDPAGDNDDWSWENTELFAESDAPAAVEAAEAETQADSEAEGWEWEYEEVPAEEEEAAAESFETAQEAAETDAGTDGEEWEWAYEEAEGEENPAAEAGADADPGQEGEEWAWEYEEVPEGEEGVDWEWEYEDAPAEAANQAPDNGESKSSNW